MRRSISTLTVAGLLSAMAFADDEPTKTSAPEGAAAAPVATAKTSTWHKSLSPAIEDARRRKTMILVRVGAPWCGWCRRLEKELQTPDVQKELANWTLVYLDADDDADEVRRLSVGPIPALRLLTFNGRPARSHDGYLPAEEFLRWLREEDAPAADELMDDVAQLPEVSESTVAQLTQLLGHRDATVREAVAKRLKAKKGLAAAEVTRRFAQGKLAARLATLDLLLAWQAPVEGLDPWQPQTITDEKLTELETWAAAAATATDNKEAEEEPLTPDQQSEARSEISKLMIGDWPDVQAIGARLAHYGEGLLDIVLEARDQADSDMARERLDWLRFRLLASDALTLKWPAGLVRLAATDPRTRHAAASELPEVVTHGDESLLIELFGHPDPFVRELSLKALHGVGGQRSSSELTKLLSDPEPNVRAAVLKQMAEKPSAKLVPQISKYVDQESDPDLIVHAARLLREIKTKDAVLCLMKLFTHSSWQVRAEAVEAATEIVSKSGSNIDTSVKADVYTKMLDVLKDDDGFVVSRAVLGLKDSDLAIAAAPLAEAAEKQPELAETVSQSLAGIQARYSSGGGALKAKGLPLVRAWLKHPQDKLRAAAIKTLDEVGELDSEKELIPALSDSSETVRIQAAIVMVHVCDARRPALPRPDKTKNAAAAVPKRSKPAPVPVAGPVESAVKTLFRLGTGTPAPTPTPATPETPDTPAAAVATADAEPPGGHELHPFESWLLKYRSGKGRLAWMNDAVEPLKVMFKSASTEEKLAAGQALMALGQDHDVLSSLLELASQQPTLIVPVSTTLRWLPWESRLDTYGKLRAKETDLDDVAKICEQLVFLRDLRAADDLWKELDNDDVNAAFAHEMFVHLLRVHGIVMQYGYYIDDDQPKDPLGFDTADVQNRAIKSGHPWQQRVALALLLKFDQSAANESAVTLMADTQAPVDLRTDAFIAMLDSSDKKKSEKAAVDAVNKRDLTFARPALAFLTEGREILQSFANGDFRLPNQITNIVVSAPDGSDKNSVPKNLKAESLEPFLNGSDGDLAARAAYLMAMLDDTRAVDRVVAQWRATRQAYGSRTWEKLAYEAIAASNDPRFLPVLDEIYLAMRKDHQHELRTLYWTIKSMTGPEVLKFRKKMRDEVGMDQLR